MCTVTGITLPPMVGWRGEAGCPPDLAGVAHKGRTSRVLWGSVESRAHVVGGWWPRDWEGSFGSPPGTFPSSLYPASPVDHSESGQAVRAPRCGRAHLPAAQMRLPVSWRASRRGQHLLMPCHRKGGTIPGEVQRPSTEASASEQPLLRPEYSGGGGIWGERGSLALRVAKRFNP